MFVDYTVEKALYDCAIKSYRKAAIMANTEIYQYIINRKATLIDKYHQLDFKIQRTIFCKKLVEEKNIVIGELKALLDLSDYMKNNNDGLSSI